MSRPTAARFLVVFCAVFAAGFAMRGQAVREVTLAELRRSFLNPPDDARIMMRWWWFGPSVEKAELARELETMKAGGIGGVEIQPVYPLALDDPEHGFKNHAYLSSDFLDSVKFANEKARSLGMRVDITLGSGWPYGGPHIPVTMASSRLRVDRVDVDAGVGSVAMPDMGAGEKLLGISMENRDANEVSTTTVRPPARGVARLPVSLKGKSVVTFFIASRTGMQVKRPSVGADGFVLDHLDRAAIDHHLRVAGEPLLRAFGAQPPTAVFSDSLEVYGADWTGDFLEEFRKRRGYDLFPHLKELVDTSDESGAVRNDWGKTLTELTEERYLAPLNAWARAHRTKLRSQTYGTPPVTLSSMATVDLPEGEGVNWRGFSSTRWVTSANHLYGRTVSSSETWTWLHSPVFRATPLDMKAEADVHFLQGVNQLVGHGWPYSPPSAGEPGWRFYAAAVFNQHNPWWIAMPEIAKYMQRVSFVLRQGKPVADVAVYLPLADARAKAALGKVSLNEAMPELLGADVVPTILDAGYAFDFIDDGAIEKVGFAGFKVLVLPGVERIPLASLKKIEAFAAAAGKVIALRRLPSLAPGLMEQKDSAAIQALAAKLFPAGPRELRFELDPAGPDFSAPTGVGFVHRKLPAADVYFVANTANQAVRGNAFVRSVAKRIESWDPTTGEMREATTALLSGRTSLALDLAPYESRVFVFSNEAASMPSAKPPTTGAVLDVSEGWTVKFGSRVENMPKLRSWADSAETKFYSGTATYEKTVTVPAEFLKGDAVLDFGSGTPTRPIITNRPGMRAWLDSPVREAAAVYVNGKLVGTVWRPPYEVRLTGLRAGSNDLRIVVGNLAINAMAGSSLPDYKLLHLKYGRRFDPQDLVNLQPLPAGILGPVVLRSR